MLGLMQDWPLLCHRIIDHAAIQHGEPGGRLALGRRADPPHQLCRDPQPRAQGRAAARADGIKLGDRVATLAWNTWRHLEAWYGITRHRRDLSHRQPAAVPRADRYIVNHAEDRMMFVDLTFVPILEKLAARAADHRALRRADRRRAHAGRRRCRTPSPTRTGSPRPTAISPGRASTRTPPPACATPPAPPAIPKGVLYSHRSNVLHSLMAAHAGCHGRLGARHRACRWCRCSTPMAGRSRSPRRWSGAKLVMPGAKLDGASIYELLDRREGHLHRRGADGLADAAAAPGEDRPQAAALCKRVVIGGSACPRAMTQTFEDNYGVDGHPRLGHDRDEPARLALHAQAGICASSTGEARLDVQVKQGHPPFGVEMKITDDAGNELPWDGKTFGRLKVRGPAVARRLLQGRGRRDPRRRRLLRHRRRRHHRPARLHADHRPLQGRDQVRRRMDLLDRDREPRGRPSRGRRGRGDRRAASEMGRAAAADHRAQEGPEGHARTRSSASWRARSPNGGCPTTSSSSTKSRTPRPARS